MPPAGATIGSRLTYTAIYNQSYRLTGQTETGSATLRDLLYGYSLRDNLTSADDLLDPAANATYSCEARQMLAGATGTWGTYTWTYDPVGNRASEKLTPPSNAKTWTYTYDAASNRLLEIDRKGPGNRTFTYDGTGNTLTEARNVSVNQAWAYEYDAAGRLASVDLDGSTVGAYLYNALGQQVHRTIWQGGIPFVTMSVHDLAGNRIAEHDVTGTVLREYIWLDGRPLAVIEGGQLYQLHWDHILRPVMATDATGAVVWAARYAPFGGIDQVTVDTGVVGQDLRFPGQWFQAETGLHQNWHRDYDPTTGRYLQADPLGLVDGPSVYGYARQSPMRYVDPEGRASALAIIAAGCLIGAAGQLAGEAIFEPCDGGEPDIFPALRGCALGAVGGGLAGILGSSAAAAGATIFGFEFFGNALGNISNW